MSSEKMNIDYDFKAVDMIPGAPPAAYASVKFFGVTLAQWVDMAVLIYTLIIIVIALPKLITAIRKMCGKSPQAGDPPCAADCPAVKRAREDNGES